MSKPDHQAIVQVVNAYIRDCHPEGVTLEVDEQGIHKVHCQWRIPIRPSMEPVNRYEYYEALTDVELELAERENLNVFLVPSDPKLLAVSEKQPQVAKRTASYSHSTGGSKRRLEGTK